MSIDCDAVLVTKDPKKKEVIVNFGAITGYGAFGSNNSDVTDPGGLDTDPETDKPVNPDPNDTDGGDGVGGVPEPTPIDPETTPAECLPFDCDALNTYVNGSDDTSLRSMLSLNDDTKTTDIPLLTSNGSDISVTSNWNIGTFEPCGEINVATWGGTQSGPATAGGSVAGGSAGATGPKMHFSLYKDGALRTGTTQHRFSFSGGWAAANPLLGGPAGTIQVLITIDFDALTANINGTPFLDLEPSQVSYTLGASVTTEEIIPVGLDYRARVVGTVSGTGGAATVSSVFSKTINAAGVTAATSFATINDYAQEVNGASGLIAIGNDITVEKLSNILIPGSTIPGYCSRLP